MRSITVRELHKLGKTRVPFQLLGLAHAQGSRARFTLSAVRRQSCRFLSNVKGLDLVFRFTKPLFVPAMKNRLRFFDNQTNFVTDPELVKLVALENEVVDDDLRLIVNTFADRRHLVPGELVNREKSTTHSRSNPDFF